MQICEMKPEDLGYQELSFINGMAEELEVRYGIKNHFTPAKAFDVGRVWLAKDPEIKGLLVTELMRDPFTNEKVLYQRLLYSVTPRATVALLNHFLDYGKKNANSVMGVLTQHTNLKESSLIKLGFKKLETVYKLEV